MKRSSQAAARFRNRISVRRTLTGVLLALISACHLTRRAPLAPSFEQQFDVIWTAYDRVYPAFSYKNVTQADWNELRARYRPRASSARTEDEFISIVFEMLAPLRDVHAWFVDPHGSIVPTYVPTALENFDRGRWTRALRDVGYVAHGSAWGEATIAGFAYLYIHTWAEQQIDTSAHDAALHRFRDAPGMIIDVRTNAGGSDATAYAFASRFATQEAVVSYVQVRTGSRYDELGPEHPRTIGPRGAWQYTRPGGCPGGTGWMQCQRKFCGSDGDVAQRYGGR